MTIGGKEGLTDLDFLGAILPQPDGSRRWVDGPLLRALHLAKADSVLLFMNEINRIPRRNVNLLITLMNPSRATSAARWAAKLVLGMAPFTLSKYL